MASLHLALLLCLVFCFVHYFPIYQARGRARRFTREAGLCGYLTAGGMPMQIHDFLRVASNGSGVDVLAYAHKPGHCVYDCRMGVSGGSLAFDVDFTGFIMVSDRYASCFPQGGFFYLAHRHTNGRLQPVKKPVHSVGAFNFYGNEQVLRYVERIPDGLDFSLFVDEGKIVAFYPQKVIRPAQFDDVFARVGDMAEKIFREA